MLVGESDAMVFVTGCVSVSADGSEYAPVVDGVRWQFGGQEYGPEALTALQLMEAEDLLCEEERTAEKAAGVVA
jgi:hypothetical protein